MIIFQKFLLFPSPVSDATQNADKNPASGERKRRISDVSGYFHNKTCCERNREQRWRSNAESENGTTNQAQPLLLINTAP